MVHIPKFALQLNLGTQRAQAHWGPCFARVNSALLVHTKNEQMKHGVAYDVKQAHEAHWSG